MPTAIELLERKTDELLDVLESMARQHCHTDKDGMTDSGAITASAEALLLLEEHRRFRVMKDYGRMVCGYWPEHDHERDAARVSRLAAGDCQEREQGI